MKMNRKKFKAIVDKYYKDPYNVLPYVLAVDFDDTLCYSKYPFLGEPTPVVKFIQSIQDLDIIIILNTCREGRALEDAKMWCELHGLRIDYYNENDPKRIEHYTDCRKIFSNCLIDDTNYGFNMKDFT